MQIMETIALWLIWGVAGMFLTLAAICALGCILYPFYIIWKGIKEELL